jgi:hypothetical protein
MRANDLIASAMKRNLAALDERTGKELLAAYGVTVPRSVVVPGAAEVVAALGVCGCRSWQKSCHRTSFTRATPAV